ncbi:MAG: hypothetical protein U0270_31500 [Labilithrix sp.]
MEPSFASALLRHRRAILGAVFAAWLSGLAWQLEHTALHARYTLAVSVFALDLAVFAELLPHLVAAEVAALGLVAVLAARHGEALDRRPTHAAMTGVALLWTAVFLVVCGGAVSALASAAAGVAFLVFALVDWSQLFALLRSGTLTEHRDAGVRAPLIVDGLASPVVLFAPESGGYRADAKGKAIVAVPIDRSQARQRLVMQVVLAVACAFIALPGGAVAGATLARHEAHERPRLEGSEWRGDIDFGTSQNRFRLEIERARDGKLEGVMDWGDVAANVEGTYEDEHLVFYDRSLRRSNGAPFVLNDRKDVQIVGDDMVGTDKDGRVRLRAVRVR